MGGVDAWLVVFMSIYGFILLSCFIVVLKRAHKYLKRRKRPKLILLQGGKKEEGPYGKSR